MSKNKKKKKIESIGNYIITKVGKIKKTKDPMVSTCQITVMEINEYKKELVKKRFEQK